jgi:imidazolonepropionase
VKNGAVLVGGGKILWAGPMEETPPHPDDIDHIDAAGHLVTPGLLDPHTHLAWAGSREKEFYLRAAGAGYMEIHNAGGGINSTSHAVRDASQNELTSLMEMRLEKMAFQGTTAVEIKSGYGLSLEEELKQLRAAKAISSPAGIKTARTFLGAHSFPAEFKENRAGYVDLLCDEMLPAVAKEGLATACDVFIEEGVFDIAQARRVLEKAALLGLKLRVHADEVHDMGASALAAELGALSAEHLIETPDASIDLLAKAGTIAVLLPGTCFCLKKKYARGREFVERGVPVALATDVNPGSCTCDNLAFILTLACLHYGFSAAEALTAVTVNAAAAMEMSEHCGRLEPGMDADLVIWDAEKLEQLPYWFGSNRALLVVRSTGDEVEILDNQAGDN